MIESAGEYLETPQPRPILEELLTVQKFNEFEKRILLIDQRVEWLCQQVMALMNVAMSNPMLRMAMNKAQKGQSNG